MSKLILPGASAAMLGSALSAPAILRAPLMMTGFYANVLTRLVPDLFAGLDVVSRELTGMIPAVQMVPGVDRAALNQDVVYPIAPTMSAVDNTPAMAIPEPTDRTIANGTMRISKSRVVPFGFVGEEQMGLNAGAGYLSIQAGLFAQALRVLVNEFEADLILEAYRNASRATGTAGTTPFATDVSASAQLRKILDDNGAPLADRAMVINTGTGANLRTLYQLTKVNEAGSQLTLRQGSLLDMHGFTITESGQAGTHDAGTAAGATTDAAGYAVGSTVITLAGAAGTGSIVAGDVITFAGDTNKYVVVSGDASVADGGTITIGAPGLREAIPAAATAITVDGDYAINVGFARSAMGAVARPPAIPEEGDLAVDTFLLVDPRSGVAFDVRVYVGYKKVRYEVGLAWGFKALKSDHIAVLEG